MRFRAGNFQVLFYVDKLVKDVIGIRSSTKDKKHVLFLDFDNTTLKKVEEKVQGIQGKHFLGSAYVFKSSRNNYHVIILDKLDFGVVCQIQYDLGMKRYLLHSLRRDYWVLRISDKGVKKRPGLIKVIPSHSENVSSYAHYLYLKRLYDIIPDGGKFDDNTKIPIIVYKTIAKKR